MPNWCSNNLSIFGDKDQITTLILAAKADDTDFSLNNLVPCPQSLREAPAGSDEIYYTIVHGDLSLLAGYIWIPAEIKGDRDALLAFVTAHQQNTIQKGREIGDLVDVTARQQYTIQKGREIADLVKSNLETHGFSNWYNWCVAKWGTKWDVEASGGRFGDDHASYSFSSAWEPPIEAIVEISKNFPDLTFDLEYCEPGMAFCGRVEVKNGEVIDGCSDDWSDVDDARAIIDSGAYDFVAAELEGWLQMMEEEVA